MRPNLIYYHKLDEGGHFAPWEPSQLFQNRFARVSEREHIRLHNARRGHTWANRSKRARKALSSRSAVRASAAICAASAKSRGLSRTMYSRATW